MEMQQLRYLEAAIRLGSLAAASSACFVSQPALSVQIKNLEDELGVKLLRRLPRGVAPTPAGEHVAQVARRVLRELGQLEKDVRRRNLGSLSVFRLGVQTFIASEVLPDVLADLPKSLGRLMVLERPQSGLIDALVANEADLVLMAKIERIPSSIAVRPLFTVPYALFCPLSHPLAQKRQPKLADLLRYELVILQDSNRIEQLLLDQARRLDVDLRIAFSGEHGISAFEMISRGLGVGLLPLSFARRAQRRRLRVVSLDEPEMRIEIVAMHLASSPLTPAGERLLERLLVEHGLPGGTG
jgi:LysR family hydrogen peroxide-inducible transcriptional activator